MPRVSKHQSELNRAAITAASAKLFRERGIAGTSVADLMGAAGLTHGGFYGHFESKEALAAEACQNAFAASLARWKGRVADAGDAQSARTSIIDGFLSTKARNSPGHACPSATLAGDVARESVDAPIRDSFAQGLEQLLKILETLQPKPDSSAARHAALADLSLLVGAQLLARATSQSPLSGELIAAARTRLLACEAGA
jgi:TetR/AcrR family transcriptional repressor of nem operon